ncbi:MAG: type II toxin-antitoxin system VapC family toxin [Dehalococcoidia bacterium]|nr:type II toxin-antitoxin system VapC family toxin [Dehalococcoidia bacterium]
MICVDSSVAAKWVFLEEYSQQARALLRVSLEQQEPIIAPPLLASEVANVIRQRQRRGQLDLSESRVLLSQFLAVPLSLQMPKTLYDRVLSLADQFDLPAVYDAHYVALAELFGATLWTADQRLLHALSGRLSFVRWIADYRT